MRHRIFRQLAMLVVLILTISSLAPGIALTTLAQPSDSDNEWQSDEFGYVIGWNDPWTDETTTDDPDVVTLTDDETTLTIRGEEEGLAPADRLQLEVDRIVYLNGTEAEITEDTETIASAEWRSDELNRLVAVVALPDAGATVIVTLVAQSSAFDSGIENASTDITLEGDPLLSVAQRPVDNPESDPTEEPTEEADETPEVTEEADETPESTEESDETPDATEEADETPDATEEADETPDLRLPTQEPIGDGVDGNSYTSPNFGYGFEWNESDWEVAPDGELSEDGYDLLTLYGDNGSLNIYAFEDYDGDAATCLEGEAEFFSTEAGVEDWEEAENADGDPIAGETDTSAFGVYTLTYADPEDTRALSRNLVDYIECREIGDGVVLVIFALGPQSSYNDHIDQVIEITDTITLVNESDEADKTPETDLDIRDEEEDETDGSDIADDEGDDPPDTEDPATPDVENDTGSSSDSGIDGSVFTSPEFGFTLEIPTTWSVEDEQLSAGDEQLVLTNGASIVTLWATTEYVGEDLAGCVTFAAEAAEHDLDLDIRVDGSPFQGDDDLSAYAAYTYEAGETEQTYFVNCQWIEEGQSVLIIIQDVASEDYATERRARTQIENSIDLP